MVDLEDGGDKQQEEASQQESGQQTHQQLLRDLDRMMDSAKAMTDELRQLPVNIALTQLTIAMKLDSAQVRSDIKRCGEAVSREDDKEVE